MNIEKAIMNAERKNASETSKALLIALKKAWDQTDAMHKRHNDNLTASYQMAEKIRATISRWEQLT